MKKTVASAFFVLSMALGMLPQQSAAQSGPIVVVDTQRILNESIVGKAARANVESQIKKGQGRIAQLKNDVEKQRADLQKQAAVLSGSALDERREQLAKKERELERASRDLRDELMRKNDAEIGKVVTEINEVIGELAERNGYGFVLERDRQSVVYASDEIDITSEVITLLDKKKVAL